MTGNDGNNVLNGGRGHDDGRRRNDTYIVDNAGDVVNESVNGDAGTDTVQSSITFSLADAVHAIGMIENLTLTGTAANATGNALNNVLIGNGGGRFDTSPTSTPTPPRVQSTIFLSYRDMAAARP